MLKSEGYKVGLYTSPHLETYNERIRINDILISDEDFVSIGEEVLEAESKIIKEYEVPTFFEIVTAIAFLYFKRETGARHDQRCVQAVRQQEGIVEIPQMYQNCACVFVSRCYRISCTPC